jgi:hypothetical protein
VSFALFLEPLKKSGAQPARNQSFTDEPKTRHLYDRNAFPARAACSHFIHNLLRMNWFGGKCAWFGTFQICVKKNASPSREVKKHAFLVALDFRAEAQRPQRIN